MDSDLIPIVTYAWKYLYILLGMVHPDIFGDNKIIILKINYYPRIWGKREISLIFDTNFAIFRGQRQNSSKN